MRRVRELSLEAPEGAQVFEDVPHGMKAWKNEKNSFTVLCCHYTADPRKRNDEWYDRACQNLRDDQIERELEINFDSRAGTKCFPYLERNEHLYRLAPPNPIPPHWKIIAGLDYGLHNPTSINLYAIDEFKRFWSYWEFYRSFREGESALEIIAKALQTHPDYHRISKIVGDPSIFNKTQNVMVTKETNLPAHGTIMSVGEMLIGRGLHRLQRGNNDRVAGMERIRALFNWRGVEEISPSHLFISPKCEKQWWELCNLVFRQEKPDANPVEDNVKKNDHAWDQLKYAALSEDLPAMVDYTKKYGQFALKNIEDEIDERLYKENHGKGEEFSVNMYEIEEFSY